MVATVQSPVPNQNTVFTALTSFLQTVLNFASGQVIQGQINRVPEPSAVDFVVMWPIRRDRIETNIDTYADCAFTANIAGSVLNVTSVQTQFPGKIAVGSTIFGPNVAVGTVVSALGTGTGGVGTYTVAPSQNVTAEQMAAGIQNIMQPTRVVIQVDVHGPNASDNAQIISTLFRDPYADRLFRSYGYAVYPLHADDPKQVPFINAENQYEDRYIVECHLQANQTLTVPQEFADQVVVETIEIEAAYPVA